MRAVVRFLVLSLFPALCLAEEIQFTFTGSVDDQDAGDIATFWNGPGPEPKNFVMTFDVDTLSPLNTATYTFGPSSAGPSISRIDVSVAATNFTLSLDGQMVLESPTGDFGFGGEPLGEFSFIGGNSGAHTQGASFFFVPDFGLGTTLQADLMGSSDPIGLLLNGSSFATDTGDPAFLSFESSRVGATIIGNGVAVPEPNTLMLLTLAGVVLGFVNRRRVVTPIRSQ